MKKIAIVLFAMILLATLATLVTAVDTNYNVGVTWNGNINFVTKTYKCINNVCSPGTIQPYQDDEGTSTFIQFVGSAPVSNKDLYVMYHYASNGCFVPKTGSGSFYGPLTTTTSSTLTFSKQDSAHCGSNVENKEISATTVQIGETVTMEADLQAAWNSTNAIANFIPGELTQEYSSHVDVYFTVNDVEMVHETYDIPHNGWQHVSYDFTPTAAGTYKLRIATKMDNDCKCEGSNYKYREFIITVPEPPAYCGDSICNDGSSATCEPDGSTKDMKCANNVFTGDLTNGLCRTSGNYACTYCGDGVKQSGAGEECDGTDGVGANQECSNQCRIVNQPSCGDSICNDGSSATCEPNGPTRDMKCLNNVFTGNLTNGRCRATGNYACTYCGDGTKQSGAGEQCDDGNGANGDGCSTSCQTEFCGDGIFQPNIDGTCDYNVNQGPGHAPNCRDAQFGDDKCTYCGDGNKENGLEQCDDGNNANGDGCSAICEQEQNPECGDGVVDFNTGEQCELPNTQNNEYCAQSMEICKDGKLGIRDSFGNCDASCGCDKDRFNYVCVPGSCGATCDSNSDCDDQNPNTIDTCKDSCTCKHEQKPYCGDGILGNTPGEQCDDGNNNDGDGCSAVCLTEVIVPEFDSTLGLVLAITIFGGFVIKKRK